MFGFVHTGQGFVKKFIMQSLLGKIKRKNSKSNEKKEPLISKEDPRMEHQNPKQNAVQDYEDENEVNDANNGSEREERGKKTVPSF